MGEHGPRTPRPRAPIRRNRARGGRVSAAMPPPPLRLALDVPDAGALAVLVVARDPLVRAALADRLRAAGAAVGVASPVAPLDAEEADVVLWDLGPDGRPPDGLAASGLPALALVPDDEGAARAWAAGARGLLLRDADAPSLLAGLVATAAGLVVLDPALADGLVALRDDLDLPQEIEPLTPREREVLALLAEGLPNKLVADRLGVSERTAKYHVAQILAKLGAHSRTEAVLRGARLGLVVI
jgi:two-component system, NarL family, nitrate/nitrite response regulator NarL